MSTPDQMKNERLLNDLLENQRSLFNRDYQLHFLKGETKPKNIGEPFLLRRSSSK
ncbi:MAG: hypothetical protein GY860_23460, partial [Desulfobacteraceae bacterium]|nr:hypothetical protein [Desulfobacteraceae bacterium]